MKILSWNVNGIRAVVCKGFLDFFKRQKPDILCLQEVKISDAAREIFSAKGGPASGWDFRGYKEYWHPAERPGYSGTAILVREDLTAKILLYLGWDKEGRVQVLDCNNFYLVNVYFPNANHELSRLDFKLGFNKKLLEYFKKLENPSAGSGQGKPLIIAGDFNVAHEEIDLARPKDNIGNPGFTDEERGWMSKFLNAGFIDSFRYFNKNKVQYSWWSYRFNARARNIGWRIDYFCSSAKIIKQIKKAFILDKVKGSDHCPVGIEIKF